MTTVPTVPTVPPGPRGPGRRAAVPPRAVSARLASVECDRYLAQLRSLAVDDWSRPTACPGWTVRDVAAHNLGMAEMAARLPEMLRQQAVATWRATRRGGLALDHLTALQTGERAGWAPERIVRRYAEVGPRAARVRTSWPSLLRPAPVPGRQRVGAVDERWTWAYLLEVVLTRDVWMHRTDTALATGRPLDLTAGHDGVLVADVVAEWADRHGRSCSIVLTGPAGGHRTFGTGGPRIEADAVQFCRAVSGRDRGPDPFTTAVPF